MEENRKIYECNDTCDANMGGTCMWKIDEELSELAKDKKYKMCEKLRKAALENESQIKGENQ